MMDTLKQKLDAAGAGAVLDKFSYAKFRGVGKQSTYNSNKTGENVISNDMLLNYVDLQNGKTIGGKDKAENADEDAPF